LIAEWKKTGVVCKDTPGFIVNRVARPFYGEALRIYEEGIADFATIDKKYHEIFFNVISSKYLNKVAFGDNPFSECKPIVPRKWWQFWKSKYVQALK
jgi:hypothetical protein